MGQVLDAGGALISEQPMGAKPMARHFPARNRIVSGLSKAVVVIEAAAKSGSLITARAALDQGREVMAVPGHPFDARAGGCNMLIADGARIVRSARDVLDGLPPSDIPLLHDTENSDPAQVAPVDVSQAKPENALDDAHRSLRATHDLHKQILDRLGPSPVQEDQLIRDLKSPVGQINPVLTDLELDGQIRREPGGYLSLITK